MLYLMIGGSASGKSEYAERAAVKAYETLREEKSCSGAAPGAEGLYYVASMYPYDGECRKRIARHRRMRADKGFQTIECYTHLEKMTQEGQVFLLECMSNLLANELYLDTGSLGGQDPCEKGDDWKRLLEKVIVEPVKALAKRAECVIVVTNEVFSDGCLYEETTQRYCEMLGYVNRLLAREADGVVEVICGIPAAVKGELPC